MSAFPATIQGIRTAGWVAAAATLLSALVALALRRPRPTGDSLQHPAGDALGELIPSRCVPVHPGGRRGALSGCS